MPMIFVTQGKCLFKDISRPASTKFFSNYIPGPKMASPGGHRFYIGFYREKHEKNLLV